MKFLLPSLAVAATLLNLTCARGVDIPDEYKTNGFAIGCQAYTFNRFTVFEAIEKTAEAGGKVIEFFPGQKLSKEQPDVKWDHDASDEVVEKVKAKLAQHHIKAVNYGVVGIPKDEAGARKIFEFAKKIGLRAVTTESSDAIDTIEKMVKEFDIKVGFHDHPRRQEQAELPDVGSVLHPRVCKDRDPRIGACADTGHWQTSGINPVWCCACAEGPHRQQPPEGQGRLRARATTCRTAQGVGEIGRVLAELKAQGFDGNISIEYEYNWENSLPEVKQCIDFVRAYSPRSNLSQLRTFPGRASRGARPFCVAERRIVGVRRLPDPKKPRYKARMHFPSQAAALSLALLTTAAAVQAGHQMGETKTSLDAASVFARGAHELQIAAGTFLSAGNYSPTRPRLNDVDLGVRLGWMLSDPSGSGCLRGNYEFLVEGFGAAIVLGPGDVLAGLTLQLRYNFVQPSAKWVPYFQIGAGGIYTNADNEHPQRLLGSSFEFNLQSGFGTRYFCTDRCAVFVEADYRHLSNAGLATRNAGLNSIGVWVGGSFFF